MVFKMIFNLGKSKNLHKPSIDIGEDSSWDHGLQSSTGGSVRDGSGGDSSFGARVEKTNNKDWRPLVNLTKEDLKREDIDINLDFVEYVKPINKALTESMPNHEPEIEEDQTEELPIKKIGSLNTELSKEDDLKKRLSTNVPSALGPGTVIEGKFTFDSPVRVDGTLTGEVLSTSMLIVGEQAVVNANIEVGTLIVFGQVVGNVVASDLIEIKERGYLKGDIYSERLAIEQGGVFQGRNQPKTR